MSVTLAYLFPASKFDLIDTALLVRASRYLDSLTKPVGSMGRLEEMAIKLFGIAGGKLPLSVDPCLIYTVAADHGIAARGVSPFPQKVTRQMVHNFLAGGAAINALCRAAGIDLKIVDAGCAGGPFADHPALLSRRLGEGTLDISAGPAMEIDTCIRALRDGFALADNAAQEGYACIGTGEMGIGNSTSASALYCAFLQMRPEDVVGPGAGAGPEMRQHKCEMVREALHVNAAAVASGSPLQILAALGGFEIATLSGLMLGCASLHLPVLVDGFICTSAWLAALNIFPGLAGYSFLAHSSAEPAYNEIMAKLGIKPYLDMRMRLGEGTGCALLQPILRAAASVYNEMASLESAGVSAMEKDRLG